MLALLSFAVSLGLAPAARLFAPAGAVTPEVVANLPRLSDPQIAPAGDRVAYVFTRLSEARKPEPRVWLVEADGTRSRELPTNGPAWAPRWSTDGSQLTVVSGAPGAIRVLLCNTRGLTCTEVAGTMGPVTDVRWSTDGKVLAFLRTIAEAGSGPKSDAIVVGEGYRHTGLWLVDPLRGEPRLLSPPSATVWKFNWSPDSRRLVALVSPQPTAEGQEYRSSLVLLDAAGGEPRPLTNRTNPHAAPAFSSDGQSVVFLGPVGDFKERGVVRVMPVDGGAAVDFLANDPLNAWDVRWRPGTAQLVAAVVRGPISQLLLVEPDGRARRLLDLNHSITPYWDAMWTLSADGKRVAYLSEAPDRAEEVFLADLEGGAPRRLTDAHADMGRLALGRQEAVQWTNPADGARVEGILVWPPDAPAGRRLPVITLLHGGPAYNWGLGAHVRNWARLFAARGYLVLLPNFRGSSGYGMKWLTANVRNWNDGPMSDVTSGLDHLVSRGLADPGRLFVGGGSYGGYLTSWIVTHTERFRAAYVLAGVSDLVTEYAMTDEPSFLIGYFGRAPYDDLEAYRASSPVTHAAHARTPTLIVHGEEDLRVPVSQAHQLFSALRHHGAETRLVLYPREGHGVREYDHQLDLMERILSWLSDHDRSGGSTR